MQGIGTSTFTDPDDYKANIRGSRIDLIFTCQRNFKARLTWLELPHLHLLCGHENLSRIAYVSLPEQVVVAFPTRFDPPLIWGGVELQPGDIVFHSLGERMHQRTSGASRWSLISLAPDYLAAHGKVLTGRELVPPPIGRVLRPSTLVAAHLRRLHTKACHLAETKPEIIAHREVVRALEQDLLHALVNCLSDDHWYNVSAAMRRHANIMLRFEDVLAAHLDRPLHTPELCTAIGVPERTLRVCCAQFLGMSPSRYLRLRRLNLVRAALRRADPARASISQLARRYGFSELGRFAAVYRTVFGEAPSTTLRYAIENT